MVEALIGSIIAAIATGALALLAQVFSSVETGQVNRDLTAYEELVVNVASSAHGSAIDKDDLKQWLLEKAKQQ